ncbi:hypothetical protein ACJX0J_039649, partial [Zea mays]
AHYNKKILGKDTYILIEHFQDTHIFLCREMRKGTQDLKRKYHLLTKPMVHVKKAATFLYDFYPMHNLYSLATLLSTKLEGVFCGGEERIKRKTNIHLQPGEFMTSMFQDWWSMAEGLNAEYTTLQKTQS